MENYVNAINAHYGRRELCSGILNALEKAGKDVTTLKVEDLSPIEEFHIGGRKPTIKLGNLAGLSEKSGVIDIGCGIGGPARALAHHFGCQVTGIDLTEEYCITGTTLTEMVGLAEKVFIRQGSALDLPFKDNTFSVAWMQHVTMNINDKQRLFKEVGRVLHEDGKFVFYEVVAGPKPVAFYPVPWSKGPELSFLETTEDLLNKLTSSGFVKEMLEDVTDESINWFRKINKKMSEEGPPPVSLANLVGSDFPLMSKNVLKNLESNSLRVVQGIYVFASSDGKSTVA